jgi:DNA-binding NarL/FixJ family response regulator
VRVVFSRGAGQDSEEQSVKDNLAAPELILVVEPDPAVRTGLARTLVAAGYQIHELESGEQALEEARGLRPCLMILGVRLRGMSGYEACQALREEWGGELSIMFVSGQRRSSDRAAGLLLGADDWVMVPFSPCDLLARVRRLTRRSALGAERSDSRLTSREREVLALLARGLDQGEVAQRLFISPKTVGTHIERILSKLRVHSRAQAIAYAYQERMVGPTAARAGGSRHS